MAYEKQLTEWNQLRSQALAVEDDKLALEIINRWWFARPWTPYYLHWDDVDSWPDPWELLLVNRYCDIARGLGILYTITLLDHPSLQHFKLINTVDDLSIVVYDDQYVLNYDRDLIVNTIQIQTVRNQFSQAHAIKLYL